MAGIASVASAQAPAAGSWSDPVTAPAEIEPLSAQSLLLDIVQCPGHYVAVGGRGAVLLSEDGKDWRQVVTPTRTTLTAAAAVDAQVWAVGHDGLILHSADGGTHWEMQRQDVWKPGADAATRDPQQGAPLLDVMFLDIRRGFAVGAYNLALKTEDGGEHWLPMTVAPKPKPGADAAGKDDIDDVEVSGKNAKNAKGAKVEKNTGMVDAADLKIGQEDTPHLNAIAHTGSGALLIVGERGSVFRSRDAGATWQRSQLPYDGSMFGVLGYEADHVIAFGLRGHVYESTDLGDHWTQLQTGTQLSLIGGAALPNGGAAIVGTNGIVLTRTKTGEALVTHVDQPGGILAAVLPSSNDTGLLLAGENGVALYQPQ